MSDDLNELQSSEPAPAAEGEFTSEKKPRFTRSTVVLGALVLAAVGGLWFMHWKSGPASAAAAEANAAQKAIKSFLGDGKKDMASMKATLSETERQVEELKQFPAAAQVPLEDLNRNPFSERPSDAKPVVGASQREADRSAALKQAGSLRVQSIMTGDSARSCMINNRFYREGDSIDGFAVERISASSVIVKKNGFRFELKAQR